MVFTGLTAAVGLLLLYAAGAKARADARAPAFTLLGFGGRRWPVAIATYEIAVGAAALSLPSNVSGPLLAVTFTAFALVTAMIARRDRAEGCGCFGRDSVPATRLHAVVNACLAGLALAATPSHATGAIGLLIATPLAGLAALALGGLGATLLHSLLSARAIPPVASLPERLVTGSAFALERRISRRSALVRLATAGSALAVAPVRYLLYPGTALAVIAPPDCGAGKCTDGYTAFCCEITGGLNACPEGTFTGGWWKCTDYRGRQLCREHGVRYYVDCNRLPGHPFPGGCHCAHNDCGRRRVACNVFRYGQCNAQIPGTTEVVCRMVTCTNPSLIPGLNCGTSLSIDNAVCRHEAQCLEPPAYQPAPAGGV